MRLQQEVGPGERAAVSGQRPSAGVWIVAVSWGAGRAPPAERGASEEGGAGRAGRSPPAHTPGHYLRNYTHSEILRGWRVNYPEDLENKAKHKDNQ